MHTLNLAQSRRRARPRLDGAAVFSFSTAEREALLRRPYWQVRRALDIFAAIVLIVALAPLTCLVAALVAFDVGLPLTFWQQRPGAGGRPFRLRKFRTMAAAHDGTGRRAPDEDRLSAIGRFLRHTRLDELPQLFNILTGEMSFVGPRPLLPVDQPSAMSARLLVRPGLTGWAQVKGGREISAADKAALDIWYVRNASFILDLEIVLKTVPLLLFGERVEREAIRQAWTELRGYGFGVEDARAEELDVPTGQLVQQSRLKTRAGAMAESPRDEWPWSCHIAKEGAGSRGNMPRETFFERWRDSPEVR